MDELARLQINLLILQDLSDRLSFVLGEVCDNIRHFKEKKDE